MNWVIINMRMKERIGLTALNMLLYIVEIERDKKW